MTGLKLKFSADHPSGAGHFPGNPIIPGALLLHEVLACIADKLAENNCTWQIKSAKFQKSVRPGDTVLVNYSQASNGEIRFECTVSSDKVISGIAHCQPARIEGAM